jgi:two-component system response regulator AtoC
VSSRRSTVMILGETGSGKEMLARFIHQQSDRRDKPFIPVDCSTLSEHLFESELFGHVKGAFTGAMRDSLGFIRAADSGTLFLDEIGELGIHLQSKLLRVIQEKCVVPVGDTRPRPVDIRIVTATNRDLQAMVKDGTFRQDLFFRLNVVILHLPPLRHREDDILPLAKHFLELQADLYNEPPKKLSQEVIDALKEYAWPGNVRELANVIEHAYVLATSDVVQLADLPPRIHDPEESSTGEMNLNDVERKAIAECLKKVGFNKAAASRMLGINIQRLNRRILKLGIHVPSGNAKA